MAVQQASLWVSTRFELPDHGGRLDTDGCGVRVHEAIALSSASLRGIEPCMAYPGRRAENGLWRIQEAFELFGVCEQRFLLAIHCFG